MKSLQIMVMVCVVVGFMGGFLISAVTNRDSEAEVTDLRGQISSEQEYREALIKHAMPAEETCNMLLSFNEQQTRDYLNVGGGDVNEKRERLEIMLDVCRETYDK